MQTIFYQAAFTTSSVSASITTSFSISSSATVVPENSSPLTTIQVFSDVSLEFTASAYDSSQDFASTVGDLRVYIKSGSTTLASFPVDDTSIYYRSYASAVPTTITPQPPYTPPSTSSLFYGAYIYFNPNTYATSSNNSFTLYDATTSTSSLNYTQSSNIGGTSLIVGDNYTLILSGSGNFYTSSITIQNNITNATTTYTASNSYLTVTNFSSSMENDQYTITATIDSISGIILTFSSSAVIPVSPTSSLSAWNSYLNLSASYISNTNNIVYLLGGDTTTNIGSLSITKGSLTNFDLSEANTLSFTTYSLSQNNLTFFPALTTSSNATYIDYSYNTITGSIPDISYIGTFICNNNQISGSVPNLSASYNLTYFDCSSNVMSGSISSLEGGGSIQYFNCSYNNLTGSIPSLDNCYNLINFNCSFNKLSSIPNLNNQTQLTSLDCSYNSLTGSIPSLSNCSALTYVNFGDNQLDGYISGSIPSTLITFLAINNLLPQSSVDGILQDLDTAGAINGYTDLSGTGNIAPSITGQTYVTSLTNKGWYVVTN